MHKQDGHQKVRNNRHGIASFFGLVVAAAVGLLVRNDLLFGLVMGTVYGSSLHLGGVIAQRLAQNEQSNMLPAKIIAAVITGIVVAGILALIQGVVGESIFPAEGDNIIILIVKHFFDSGASVAVGAGVLVGAVMHGAGSE